MGPSFITDARNISGSPMRMHWFDPRTGKALKIGVAVTRVRFGIVPPSELGWSLVFYNDKKFMMARRGK